MVDLLRKLFNLFRRVFFFFLFLCCQGVLALFAVISSIGEIWSSFLRPLMVDFWFNMVDIFLDYFLLPLLSLIGQILWFLVDLIFIKILMRVLEALCLLFFFLWEICE
jgi:hypothetical protein